jgi:hypothetical protein
MGLFDNFFRKKQNKFNLKQKTEFELLMIDWFSDAKLNYKKYKNDFYVKAHKIFIEQKNIKEKIQNSAKEKQILDLNIAFIYLIYHYPNTQLLKKLNNLFYDRERKIYPTLYISSCFSKQAYQTFPKLEHIHNTAKIIWKINNRILHNQNPFEDIYEISRLKYNDADSFLRLLNFIKPIKSNDKLIKLLDIYCYREVNYKTGQLLPISDNVEKKTKNILSKEIDKYNKNDFFQLNIDLYQKLDSLIHYKENFTKWNETEYNKRNRLNVDDFEELKKFISNNDIKEVLKHYIFSFNHRGYYDGFYKKILLYLRDRIDFDEQFLLDIVQIYPQHNTMLIEQIFIPIAEKLNISYNSPIREKMEQVIIFSSAKQSYLNFFIKLADKIPVKIKKEIIKAKYSGGSAVISTAYGWTSFCPGEKYKNLKRDLKNISKIIELPVIGIKDEFIDGYQTYIKIIHKNVVKKISYSQLNEILYDSGIGFQLVPIPIKIKKIIKEKYYKGKNYQCGLSLINKQQYDYLINEYIPNNFPEIDIDKFYQQYYHYNYNNPLTFDEYLKEKSENTDTSNKFLSDYNWNWFKEKHVDKLPNHEDWYNIMHIIVSYSGSKKPSKRWKNKIKIAIEKHSESRYYKELRTLIDNSINEDFWYFDDNRNALKGIAWSCSLSSNTTSLMILKQIIEKAYAKIPNVGPRSVAIGNAALEALIEHPNSDSFGILNLLKNQTKYARFSNVLDKYINKYIENSDEDEQVLADKSIPDFDFVNGEKIVNYENFSIKYIIKNQKLTKKWIINSKETSKTPALIKENYPKEIKEITAEFKSINAFLKTTKTRIKTFWLNNRKWTYENWVKNIKQKEMLRPWLERLVWKNETQNNSFILIDNKLFDIKNKEVVPNNKDLISLWHPITESDEEILNWQKYIIDNGIEQTERQVFREFYPFTKNELKLDKTPRFNHHFLKVNKLMAIANSVGWVFTYVHEDVNWPRTYIKSLNITAHLQCDYDRDDFAIPTKGLFITQGDTRNITYGKKFDKLTFDKIPNVTLSEICRDVDLFIATTSVAHDIELSKKTELLKHYREEFSMGKFSDNAQAKIRKQIIKLIGEEIGLKSFDFEKNYLLVQGKWNTYSINLGSGFAQIKDTKRHIPIIPEFDIIKKKVKKSLPVKDDETFYIILAKALFLQNDEKITDNKVVELLKSV